MKKKKKRNETKLYQLCVATDMSANIRKVNNFIFKLSNLRSINPTHYKFLNAKFQAFQSFH